jgi:hypothetical protein
MNEVAPAFASIAADSARTPDHLWAWLSTAHPQMPDFDLSYQQIRAVIASSRACARSRCQADRNWPILAALPMAPGGPFH